MVVIAVVAIMYAELLGFQILTLHWPRGRLSVFVLFITYYHIKTKVTTKWFENVCFFFKVLALNGRALFSL